MHARSLTLAAAAGCLLSLATVLDAQAPAGAVAAKPAVLTPGDNLVADGLPEIPATIADGGRPLHRVPFGALPPGIRPAGRC